MPGLACHAKNFVRGVYHICFAPLPDIKVINTWTSEISSAHNLNDYNFTGPEVLTWETKGPPPQKEEKTGH